VTACHDLSYNEWGVALQKACSGERVPLAGSFEITFRCNLRCLHCYIADYSGREELSTEEVRRILGELADEGCLWLLLTGGEVLTRRDFPDLYRHAKRLGFLITVFTNGTLVDERVADLLAEYPPLGTEITLYGLSDETYLKTTGFPGRYTAVRRGIDRLLARGLRLTLKAVAMEPLTAEIPAMEAFARSLGVPFRYDPIIHARLDGSLSPTAVRAAPETVVAFDAADPRRLDEWQRYYRLFVANARPSASLLSCGAGVNSFHIDPRGRLFGCEALPLDGYDLRRGSFRDGWYDAVAALRRRHAAPENVCAPCELRNLCDRCPATAMLETGSPDGWVPYFCEVTHRRAALLEERHGDPVKARTYLAHAEKVAAGWTPAGAILPRAGGLRPPSGVCASGGCAAGGCGAGRSPETTSRPISIELPGSDPGPSRETAP
jgi:radical SAM protein with 4Fe4S-binding SPASM domain